MRGEASAELQGNPIIRISRVGTTCSASSVANLDHPFARAIRSTTPSLTYFHLRLGADREGAGSRWDRATLHNMTFEYHAGQRGLYSLRLKPPIFIAAAGDPRAGSTEEITKRQVDSAGATARLRQATGSPSLIAARVFNIVASYFYYQNAGAS